MADSSKRAAKLAKEITAFAQRHGGGADGQIAYVGQSGARISLVAADGTWGDLMAPSVGAARQAAELAGVTVHESFDGEMAARMATGPYEWNRMAGLQLGGETAGHGAARQGRPAPAAPAGSGEPGGSAKPERSAKPEEPEGSSDKEDA